jgi:hypothetical protein
MPLRDMRPELSQAGNRHLGDLEAECDALDAASERQFSEQIRFFLTRVAKLPDVPEEAN